MSPIRAAVPSSENFTGMTSSFPPRSSRSKQSQSQPKRKHSQVYGDRFHRIEAISRIDGKLRMLDFKHADVRAKVLNESDARFAYDRAAVAY